MNDEQQNINQHSATQHHGRNRWGIWFLGPQLVLLVLVFVLAMQWKNSLRIQHVVVSGTHILPATDVYTLAKVPMKNPLFGTGIQQVRERVMTQPFVKSAVVYRQLPDIVHIHVLERIPIATLNIGQLYYLDEEGVVLPYCRTAVKLDVPVISGIGGLDHVQVGVVAVSNEVFQAIDILKTARLVDTSIYRMISEVNMNNGGDIILYSVDGGVPIALGRGDIGKKLVTLRTFIGSILKSEDQEELRSIDLRFDEQVVVKWDQKSERYPKGKPL